MSTLSVEPFNSFMTIGTNNAITVDIGSKCCESTYNL